MKRDLTGMKRLKKLISDLHESVETNELDEGLTAQGRISRSRSAKKRKAQLALGRKRARRQTAGANTIKQRAQRRARRAMEKQIMGGSSGKVNKSHLSHSGLNRLQAMVDARKGQLEVLRNKLLKDVRKDTRRSRKKKK